VEGKKANCSKSITGFHFCPAYQTVCSYKDKSGALHEIGVNALAKLLCSTSTFTYTVDNYRPN
ncbi:MAG: hypothetical protein ACK4M7_06120, partial [Burkholderiales bacterium]